MAGTWHLYEMDRMIRELVEEHVNEDTGEISDDIAKALESMEMEREVLIEGIALQIREMKAEAAAVKIEYQKMHDRSKSIENRADSLKERLATFVGVGNKIKTARVSIHWTTSSSLRIEKESELPLWALRTTTSPDKRLIKDKFQTGTEEEREQLGENVKLARRSSMVVK